MAVISARCPPLEQQTPSGTVRQTATRSATRPPLASLVMIASCQRDGAIMGARARAGINRGKSVQADERRAAISDGLLGLYERIWTVMNGFALADRLS
tara:strand:+ start:73227 stop:73520 length:294 start_codon:yes stop_codon:yes gene_type:complete